VAIAGYASVEIFLLLGNGGEHKMCHEAKRVQIQGFVLISGQRAPQTVKIGDMGV
jgi:hypothetical protein